MSIGRKNLAFVKRYKPEVRSFKDLPLNYQKAIWVYVDSGSDIDDALSLKDFTRVSAKKRIGITVIPMQDLQREIVRRFDPEEVPFTDFPAYHRWYVSNGGIPQHKSVWPVILSQEDTEVLEDGWHRFHSYVRRGLKFVPVAYFP